MDSDQVLSALDRANEIRFARADDKRAIKAGELDASELLAHPPDHWARATVMELLLNVQQVGRSTAYRWLQVAKTDGQTRLQDLNDRQRKVLGFQIDLWNRRRAGR